MSSKKKFAIRFVSRRLESEFIGLKKCNPKFYESINRTIERLSREPYRFGRYIPSRRAGYWIRKFNVEKVWIYNLTKSWRMIYSVVEDEVWIVGLILEWLDHKEYDRRRGR